MLVTMNSRVPVEVQGNYVICFEAQPEKRDMAEYFIRKCGWTPSGFAEVEYMPWFVAVVSIWQNGEQLAVEYLGACAYEQIEDFYTTQPGYYNLMKAELLLSVARLEAKHGSN